MRLVNAFDMGKIARVYDIHEILLHNFLYPAQRSAVVLRGLFDRSGRERDFCEVSHLISGNGSAYWLPSKNLLQSDISMAIICLGPQGETAENEHPGFELLLPLTGSIAVRFKGSHREFSASAARDEILQYSSQMIHQVYNDGPEPAEVLAIGSSSTWEISSPGHRIRK